MQFYGTSYVAFLHIIEREDIFSQCLCTLTKNERLHNSGLIPSFLWLPLYCVD